MNLDLLTKEERALVLKKLRECRDSIGQRIEMQKSQRRRGLMGAKEEHSRLEDELKILESAIRKIWRGAE